MGELSFESCSFFETSKFHEFLEPWELGIQLPRSYEPTFLPEGMLQLGESSYTVSTPHSRLHQFIYSFF